MKKKNKDELRTDIIIFDENTSCEDKYQITDKIIKLVADNKMTTKEVNEICFAVLYHMLLNKENIIIMREKMGVDILQLKGNDLVDFVHAINKTMVQLKDDFIIYIS